MKTLLQAAAILALVTSPAFAQSPGAQSQSAASGKDVQGGASAANVPAVQKIRQNLLDAGFTDVKVMAESFVVKAKSKDGDPVLMTIGPRGMSIFEAVNAGNPGPNSGNTTGQGSGNDSSSSTVHGPATMGSSGAVESQKMGGPNTAATGEH
jgi:hypothetical protein